MALLPYAENSAALIVADGMGGTRGGQQASSTAVHAMRASLSAGLAANKSLRAAIINGIEQANVEVVDLGIGAATTLAAIEVGDGHVRAYHVGDSLILATGSKGKVKLETVSHSPVGFAVEAGVMGEESAMHHEDRHLVSNVLGTADMRIEIGSPLKLAARDTVLLASDGLFDNLYPSEIVSIIRKGGIERAARQLVETSRQRMAGENESEPSKPDDLSFIIYRPRSEI